MSHVSVVLPEKDDMKQRLLAANINRKPYQGGFYDKIVEELAGKELIASRIAMMFSCAYMKCIKNPSRLDEEDFAAYKAQLFYAEAIIFIVLIVDDKNALEEIREHINGMTQYKKVPVKA